jgi:hypothetical protein
MKPVITVIMTSSGHFKNACISRCKIKLIGIIGLNGGA